MKKLCVFLMTILVSTIVFATKVDAQTTFYEGDRIAGVYMTRDKGPYHLYQQARFFRRSGDNKVAYCIEPFSLFQDGSSYEASSTSGSLTNEQMNRITKIAYYGYGNRTLNHTSSIWYAVTQLMVWRVVEPTGNFYFTQGLDGNQIYDYDSYINELNNEVDNHDVKPSFDWQAYTLAKDSTIEIKDTNNVLQYFNENSDMLSIDKATNTLKVEGLKPGVYDFELTKDFDVDTEELYFFDHPNSQNLMLVGKVPSVIAHVRVNIEETEVNITKVDADSKSTTPSGEAELKGAEYDILDKDKKLIKHIVIDDDCKVSLKNLAFGTYYIKETKPGVGYELDEELHEFVIDEWHTKIELTLENKVIKRKVEIHKKYGNDSDSKAEAGIVFNVFNNKGELVDSMITDENGYAYLLLPYGHYTIKQETSTEGYSKVDDFNVDITGNEDDVIEFDLLDYVIEVPNTKVNHQSSTLVIILMILLGFVYVKKEIHL